MQTTRLSSKGQVVLPQAVRERCGLNAGDELVVMETERGILLSPARKRPLTGVNEVFGSLRYAVKAKSLEDMEDAIRKGAHSHSAIMGFS